jgi:hypothetical protein
MAHALMVWLSKRGSPRRNLDIGLSHGRWAFPPTPAFEIEHEVMVGDLVFFGVGGTPRPGGKLAGWHPQRLAEAHLARIVAPPYRNKKPFWPDELKSGKVRWNPTLEIEYLGAINERLALAPGVDLSAVATEALYVAGVSRKVHRVSTAGSPALRVPAGTGMRRLRRSPETTASGAPVARLVAVESARVLRARVRPRPETTATRREIRLTHAYRDYLIAAGETVRSLEITRPGSPALRSDIIVPTRGLLVEAKGSVSRDAIRMAIGQVIDYGRFWDAKRRGVLLPRRPNEDSMALIAAADMTAVWQDGNGFADSAAGAFT